MAFQAHALGQMLGVIHKLMYERELHTVGCFSPTPGDLKNLQKFASLKFATAQHYKFATVKGSKLASHELGCGVYVLLYLSG